MALQPVYRSGSRNAALGRRLNAARAIAPRILAATIECSDYAEDITVVPCRAKFNQVKCFVGIDAGRLYFMVRSTTFVNRWYVCIKANGAWICSDKDVTSRCVAKIEAYKATRKAA